MYEQSATEAQMRQYAKKANKQSWKENENLQKRHKKDKAVINLTEDVL
ncbi:hypothetical protein AGMMS49936_10500 [Endomicrobiia bacterium]|nr:hypothetical protein AGMMS49936_10500 [Endomicrobiia bacterium]